MEPIDIATLPRPTIIKDGREVDTSAIDNYDQFMSFLMQASMAANIAQIKKHFDDCKSIGRAPSYPINNITPISQEIPCEQPAQSLYIVNNGPGQIFVAVNSSGDSATPIAAGKAAYFPFETHVIQKFYVWSAAGTTATATAILKR
jgi:hypothetical protein